MGDGAMMMSERSEDQDFIECKDDGIKRRIAFYIEGKHGRIGIIRPDRPSTAADRKEFAQSLTRIVANNIHTYKTKETPENQE